MEEQEFSRLMRQYQAYVYTICYRCVQDAALAEDLAQETFLSAYLHSDRCPRGSEKAWLARIAVNKAKDSARSGWNRHIRLAQQNDEDEPELPAAVTEQPEELTISRETLHEVRQALYDLQEPYHEVAILYFLRQKTVDEVAEQTGRPTKTVYTQLARAKKLLTQQLKEAYQS